VKRLAVLAAAAVVLYAAWRVNAAVHGIGYHWWPDPVHCPPPDHAVVWWDGRTERIGCGESLTIGLTAAPRPAGSSHVVLVLILAAATIAIAYAARRRIRRWFR
jgi:hypothetical protein